MKENLFRVEELLKKNKDGLTIQDISVKLELSRNTVTVALAEMKGAGKLRIREIGKAKLHYLN